MEESRVLLDTNTSLEVDVEVGEGLYFSIRFVHLQSKKSKEKVAVVGCASTLAPEVPVFCQDNSRCDLCRLCTTSSRFARLGVQRSRRSPL
jgi:hypothetical protein